MPLQKLEFRPGLNREGTDYANEGGWYDGDKVRFRSGFPEKLGGWTRLSNNQFIGVCRSMWNWVAINGSNYLGLGTSKKYYIESGTVFNNITPYIYNDSPALNGPFAVVTGNTTMTITDAQYAPNIGDYITITGAVGLGGNITATILNSDFVVTGVGSGNYTVTLPITPGAGNTGTGGSAVVIYYEYPVGNDVATVGTGWGAGPWSRGSWGSGYTSGIPQQLRLWSNDNFGQDLIIAPRGGAIAYWSATAGLSVHAVPLAKAAVAVVGAGDAAFCPVATNQVISSAIQRFVIALGANSYDPANSGTSFNPMLVRWSDQESVVTWTPAATNQAGSLLFSHGSQIITAMQARQEILVWTDSSLYSLQYVGAPVVWSSQIVGDNTSIAGENAVAYANGVAYWMGVDKFYKYDGRTQTLPCDLRQYVFENINKLQFEQVFAGTNEGFNEIWWFYVSNASTDYTIDSYVVFNYAENKGEGCWYYGSMARTAWMDSGLRDYPIAATYSYNIVNHEQGLDNNETGTTLPIEAFVNSAEFDVDDGDKFGFVWRVLPDFKFDGSTATNPQVTLTLKPMQNSGSGYNDPTSLGGSDNATVTRTASVPIEKFTGQVYIRVRGRQMAMEFRSTGLGVQWQAGSPRIDIRQDGRR
jgi:hypothetical protein